MATAKKMKQATDKFEDVEKYVTEVIYRLMTDEFNLPEVKAKSQESQEKYVVRMACLSDREESINFSIDVGNSVFLGASLQKNWSFIDFKKDIKGYIKEFFTELEGKVNAGEPSPNMMLSLSSRLLSRDWVELSNRGVEFMKLTSDLDVKKFTFQGKFKDGADFFDAYFSTGKWKINQKDERDAYFLKQWKSYEIISPLDVGRSDLDAMYNFFNDVRDSVKDKEIEKNFLKLFSEKTAKADVEFNKRLCVKLMDLVELDNIESEKIKKFIETHKVNAAIDSNNISKSVDFSGYETFSFNESAFTRFKLTKDGEVKVGLDYSFKDDLFKTMLDLVTDKASRDYTGVTKLTPFKLPNGQSGYFLEVNDNYTAEKFEKALMEASNMIQDESIKDPVSYTSGIRKFQNKEYRTMFASRISKLVISKKVNAAIDKKEEFDDTELTRGSSFKL